MSKRFSLVEVAGICLVVATLAGFADVGSARHPRTRVSVLKPHRSALRSIWAKKALRSGWRCNGAMGRETPRNAEEWVIRDYFQDKRGGVFLDVGAADAREWNNTYFLETTLGWSGLAIDAQPEFARDYARLRPRTRFFSLFVSDASDTVEDFYVPTDGPLGASSNREFAGRDEATVEVRSVRTITLNDLLAREGIARVDFLSMDIELGEPRALAGFDIERYRPALVCIEVHPQVRQELINYFHHHRYVLAGKYLGVDAQNLYFMPDSSDH